MSLQTTLLTSHKGTDLHAATALRVMRERLEGGQALRGLYRCELHTYRDGDPGLTMERLLAAGRFFNPNKHHFGHFEGPVVEGMFDRAGPAPGSALPPQWPGIARDTDRGAADENLYDALLGGTVPDGCSAVDLVSFPLGQDGPLVSGILWRLNLQAGPEEAAELGELLAITRSRKQGLLINPHMEGWLTAVRQEIR